MILFSHPSSSSLSAQMNLDLTAGRCIEPRIPGARAEEETESGIQKETLWMSKTIVEQPLRRTPRELCEVQSGKINAYRLLMELLGNPRAVGDKMAANGAWKLSTCVCHPALSLSNSSLWLLCAFCGHETAYCTFVKDNLSYLRESMFLEKRNRFLQTIPDGIGSGWCASACLVFPVLAKHLNKRLLKSVRSVWLG